MRASLHRHSSSSGFSLVELGIMLAVIGLLLSGIVIPLSSQLRDKAFLNASNQVRDAIDAVVGYTVSNRTPGIRLAYGYNRTTNPNTSFQFVDIPAGRPYLPCPDTDGDGLENRRSLAFPILGREDQSFVRLDNNFSDEYDSPSGSRRNPFGGCERFYGGLPWRTLGLEPTDVWGSQLSYVVNPNFAIGVFGFDQHTRAGTINIVADFSPIEVNDAFSAEDGWAPIIPCLPTDPIPCSVDDSLALDSRARTNILAELPRIWEFYNLSSRGDTTRSLYTDPNYIDFIDGLPFVILSHGQNRTGSGALVSGTYQCNDISAASNFERYNSFFSICNSALGTLINVYSATDRHINIFAYERVSLDRFSGTRTANYQNVSTGQVASDDIVGWLTRRELVSRLRTLDILPAPVFAGLLRNL